MPRISLLSRLALICCVSTTACGASVALAKADTLIVNVSEDAYLGDAVFTVSVDNKKIGNNFTATALRSAGATQNFTLTGTWGTGAHVVNVRFLVDAYGGSPAKDRNLYVNAITYNGVKVVENYAELSAGGVNFPIAAAPVVKAVTFEPGIDLSGLEMNAGTIPGRPNYDYGVPNLSELTYYHGKGINVVRLPVLWERLQQGMTAGFTPAIDPTYLALIKNLLTEAGSLGMGVFVDVHDYGSYNGNKIGGGTVTATQFATFWKLLATQLKGTPGLLGYDLMNEPEGMPSASAWPTAAQAAVYAIRTVDTTTPISVEGDGWASAGSWASINGSLNILDPSSSIIYQAHVYGDRDSSGTHFDWATEVANGVTVNTIAQRVAVFDTWCKTNAHVCMVGEVGVGNNNAGWNTELQNGLAQMKADGLLTATYWAGGPWWGSYAMSVEPSNNVDAPQMTVLASFAN